MPLAALSRLVSLNLGLRRIHSQALSRQPPALAHCRSQPLSLSLSLLRPCLRWSPRFSRRFLSLSRSLFLSPFLLRFLSLQVPAKVKSAAPLPGPLLGLSHLFATLFLAAPNGQPPILLSHSLLLVLVRIFQVGQAVCPPAQLPQECQHSSQAVPVIRASLRAHLNLPPSSSLSVNQRIQVVYLSPATACHHGLLVHPMFPVALQQLGLEVKHHHSLPLFSSRPASPSQASPMAITLLNHSQPAP